MSTLPPDTAVRVEGLGKRYRIGVRFEREGSLLYSAGRALAAPVRNFASLRRLRVFGEEESEDVIWALRDVSFELRQGEVLGVIGRNGAGKTTLLKILSRVTGPTTGVAQIRGRSGSLLEVGTGFHPDLTGRENVYLNGTMHGMTRRDVDARFDEIVEFAELERFVDTPVKRYSSGMYVRLAFSVAAHLDPDVLLTDEVLAVGDAAFQQKCLGRMREVASGGRTVLFVSHNRSAVAGLCTRAIWLDGGRLRADGPVDELLDAYHATLDAAGDASLDEVARQGDGSLRVRRIRFVDREGEPLTTLRAGEDARIVLEYETRDGLPAPLVTAMVFVDGSGGRVATLSNELTGDVLRDLPAHGELVCDIGRLPLNEGRYSCSFKIRVGGDVADHVVDAAAFTVEASRFYPTRRHPPPQSGLILLDHAWHAEPVPAAGADASSAAASEGLVRG